MEWVNALIGSLGLICVALIQRDRKATRKSNSREHSYLVQKIDMAARTLGLSLDRVERNLESRIDSVDDRLGTLSDRVNEHIRDHATGAFSTENTHA